MYDEYDDGDDGGASLGRKVALGIGVVAIAAAGFFAFKAVTKDEGGAAADPASTVSESSVTGDSGSSTPGADDAPTTAADAPTTTSAGSVAPSTTEGATSTTAAAPTTTAAAAAPPTTAAPAPPTPAPATYDTLPDGSPAWVIALYGTDSIAISGAVPDQAAKDRLEALAVSNAKPGQAASVINDVTINPAIPRNVGVRVVELTSARFPEGSTEVLPEHAAELDRVATIMNALPNITALVIGHADQRGDEGSNYVISEARADAVTNYLAGRGIAPSRLSSRAVGEADLLTLDDDDTALALNRRTEFVFFGLLQG